MATMKELEQALVNADRAGDTDSARKLAAFIVEARKDPANLIPGNPVSGTVPPPPEPTLGEQVVGAGETALSLATGATGGAIGLTGGLLKGLAEQILSGQFGTPEAADLVEQEALKGAQALTYQPRTATGQAQTQAAGEMLQQLIPAAPLTAEMGLAAGTARQAVPAVATAAAPAIEAGMRKVTQPVQSVAQRLSTAASAASTPGTAPGVGAAGVDIATVRQSAADDLPVPIKLTEGQKTRQFEAQRFERETAKAPELGEPIRERFAQQNQQLQQNLDAFIDMTGAEAPDIRSVGLSVDEVLRARAAKDKTKIRTLYKEADKAGEMSEPVNLQGVIDVLNESQSAESTAPVLSAAKKELVRLGGAELGDDGSLTLSTKPGYGELSLKDTEQLRKFVNKVTGNDPTNIKFAGDLKRAIDAATEGKGGKLYKQARRARSKYAKDYENVGVVKNLLGLKRGTSDRAIAMEDVFKRVVLEPSTSLDTMRHIRRLLQTKSGDGGKQAWRELQGATLKYIRDEATKNVARDELGNPIVSAARLDKIITQLDKTGKLDYIFGKKGAEQLHVINDVAKDVLTSPPGSVNTSNTASVVLAAMDMAISGAAGVPAPVLSGFRMLARSVKDAKTKARVKRVLGE